MTTGKVYLVGAGPADPGLITVRGLYLIQQADAIVYDRLISERLLAEARPATEKFYVGKGPGSHSARQEDINRLLVSLARQGKRVVRLKGGDPFVFGRGGEEALALAEAGVPFEVVPGVTSAIAVPAYAGIPVTHRQVASSFAVVTGHEDPERGDTVIRWDKLATAADTLVILMGVETLDNIVKALLRHGLKPGTPVAVVQWGTYPRQRTVTGTLRTIQAKVEKEGFTAPAIAIVGSAVKLRKQLAWFERRPLLGKRVLVTRSRQQASKLAELLLEEGADPVELPTIEIKPPASWEALDKALRRLGDYHAVIFTSVNAVDAVFSRMQALGYDARRLAGVQVAAVGTMTAQALEQRGVRPDYVPDEFTGDALLKLLERQGVADRRFLLPRTDIAPEGIALGLKKLGATVEQVEAYRTVRPEPGLAAADWLHDVDAITFASSSAVRNLLDILGRKAKVPNRVVIACIGPTTAATAKELGLRVDLVAREHTIPGLVKALVGYFSPGAK